MNVIKRVLCPQRLRQVPSQFSWIDHRLVRHRHICRCSHPALALYLFLVTVGDGQGLSYYSDGGIFRLLRLDPMALASARRELIDAGLIAYQPPLYQVLALDPPRPDNDPPGLLPANPPANPTEPRGGGLMSFGDILHQIMEHAQ
jgi:hypothetical protein